MNDTNIKLDDVAKAFAALPQKGRNVICKGKVKAGGDLNTHIQGLAPYRTFHLITHSDFGEQAGRLLIVDRTPGERGARQRVEVAGDERSEAVLFSSWWVPDDRRLPGRAD